MKQTSIPHFDIIMHVITVCFLNTSCAKCSLCQLVQIAISPIVAPVCKRNRMYVSVDIARNNIF